MDPSYPAPGPEPFQPPSPGPGPFPPPSPGQGPPQPPNPAAGWPAPWAAPSRSRRPHQPLLVVRARADSRLVAGAVAGGAGFDIAARSGLATVGAAAWLLVAAAAVALSGRIRGRSGALLIGAAPVLGLLLFLRSSPWVIVPVTVGIAVLVFTGVSLGADGSRLNVTFPGLAARTGVALGHLGLGPGLLSPGGLAADGVARRRALALGRGALLGVPVMIVVGVLLGLADPIFRSWFDLPAILQHVALVAVGAWAVLGLQRAASAERPSPSLPAAPALGTTEAAVVLSGLCALYAAFVVAQFVALSGAGHRILVTHGLTYAEYARSGFFQLLACAGITLVVLLGVQACANPSRPVLLSLSGLTVALTLGVVVVAVLRLRLYEAAFGLTMLRLACTVAAVWIGVVFAALGATLVRRGLPRRYLPAAVLISGLIFVAGWGAANPAAIVAQTNLGRADHGRTFDVRHAASLGPDATPALLAGLRELHQDQAAGLRNAICAQPSWPDEGAAFNVSKASADEARARACRRPG
jgi:hypothetical protein